MSKIQDNSFLVSFLDTQLIMPLNSAPPINIPIAGLNTGIQSLCHKSKPKLIPEASPITAITSHAKPKITKKTSATKIKLSQFNNLSFSLIGQLSVVNCQLEVSSPCSLVPVPCSLFPVPCSLFPIPCSLFPIFQITIF